MWIKILQAISRRIRLFLDTYGVSAYAKEVQESITSKYLNAIVVIVTAMKRQSTEDTIRIIIRLGLLNILLLLSNDWRRIGSIGLVSTLAATTG